MFTLFYRLAQAENWTKTKDFHLSCKFNICVSAPVLYGVGDIVGDLVSTKMSNLSH